MADYSDFIKNNIAPYAAKKIGVYNSSGTRVGSITLGEFKPSYGERLYRFGFLSDVHNETDQADGNSDDLMNALTYFNEKESVEFVCISGDLTQTSYSTGDLTTEMATYQSNINSANIGKSIYVTTGNHDCPSSSDVNISTFYQYAGLSDIAPADGAEFSYEVTKTHTTSSGTTVTDHFLFLTMKRYEFTTNTYSTTDITWLHNKLEAYKEDRCFVITHMFFPTYAGNLNDIYPSGNWLSGTMLTQVKALIDAYPRSIWFSGHSHWKWYLQKYQDRANVYPTTNIGRTTGWAVHMPSCARPIDSDGTSRVSMDGQSEGAIIDVYENYIDIRGIEFKGASDTDYAQRYIPIAQYRLYTEPGETGGSSSDDSSSTDSVFMASIENWQLNPNKTNGTDTLTDDITVTTSGSDVYTKIMFDAAQEGFRFTAENLEANAEIQVLWDSVTIECPEGTEIDTPEHFGWYDGTDTSTDNNKGYSLTSPFVTSTTDAQADNGYYCCQFNTSSTILTQNTDLAMSTDSPMYVTFKNLRYIVTGYTGDTDCGNTKINSSSSSSSETSTGKDTLVVKVDAKSSGLAIPTGQSDTQDYYVKYDAIKITTADGTDITSTITSTGNSASNSYLVGCYSRSGDSTSGTGIYEYQPAGTYFLACANTHISSNYGIGIVQASSSSSVASTNIYVQLTGIKYTLTPTDEESWISVDSTTTLSNGSNWNKSDLSYTWVDEIVDDPTTLTFATTYTES